MGIAALHPSCGTCARARRCPPGKSTHLAVTSCPVPPAKIFHSRFTQITFTIRPVPPHMRGGSRSSRTRGGMRWTRTTLLTRACACGRRSRVVLMPRRWHQVGGGNSVNDGGKKARSPGRARRKPLKPLRAGMPGDSGELAVNTRVHLPLPCAHEAAGASGTRHSPRPLMAEGGTNRPNLARNARRDREAVSWRRSCVLASLREAKRRSNPRFLCCYMDCFASLAMTIWSFRDLAV